MKKILLLLLFFSQIGLCQNDFHVDFDFTTFFQDQSSGILEIYYSFDQSGMSRLEESNKKYVGGMLSAIIQDKNTSQEILNKKWNFTSEISEGEISKNLTGLLRFRLNTGNYECTLKGMDIKDESRSDSSKFDFTISPLDSNGFAVSGLQISSEITQFSENPESIFYKNTLEVIPNPSLIFGEEIPVLYYYCELYNIDKDIQSENLTVKHYLFDSKNSEVYSRNKFIKRNNNSIVEIGAIKIVNYPSGVYNLVISVCDSLKKKTLLSSKKIFVYNPSVKDTSQYEVGNLDLLSSELAVLSENELDVMFEESKYVANDDDITKWEKLTGIEAKREFLSRFWKSKDENPRTPQNETQIEYFKRVRLADEQFRSLIQKKGWKSDKGRVFVIYGPPSEIERHPNEKDINPYEIWKSENIEGGVMFVFADYSGFNDYRLIHSDKRGELADENWYRSILQN